MHLLSAGFLKITKALNNVTKSSGEAIKLRCEAVGDPPPTRFEWLKNEAPIVEEKNRIIVKRYNVKVRYDFPVTHSRTQ